MPRCGGRARIAGVLALSLWVAPAVARASCEPWPGEPAPLPTPGDPDEGRAAWALLRAQELAELATQLESSGSPRAESLWRHLLCIEPRSEAALTGLERSRSVRVHRPELRDAAPGVRRDLDPWKGLGAPLPLGGDLRAFDRRGAELGRALRALGQRVRGAEFEAALAAAGPLRDQLGALPPGASRDGLVVEVEVLTATAHLALGQDAAAQDSLRRALMAEPGLRLDEATTSPKVIRALEAARRQLESDFGASP